MTQVPTEPVETSPPEPRIGEVVGDRLCATCGFNLAGQVITRERHYNMLIARCPECGSAAALQEYPQLGRWANRLGYLLAAAYLVVVLGLICGSGGLMFGLAMGTTEIASQKFVSHLVQIQQMRAQASTGPQPANWTWQANYVQDRDWWAAADKWQIFQEAGGFADGVEWSAGLLLITVVLSGMALGMVFAVAMPHLKSWRRLLVPGAVVLLGLTLLLVVSIVTRTQQNWFYPQWAGPVVFRPVVVPPTLCVGGVAILAGMCVGRPVARWLLPILLPPRLRGPMAFLWLVDGRPMPRNVR